MSVPHHGHDDQYGPEPLDGPWGRTGNVLNSPIGCPTERHRLPHIQRLSALYRPFLLAVTCDVAPITPQASHIGRSLAWFRHKMLALRWPELAPPEAHAGVGRSRPISPSASLHYWFGFSC
jgi:hypothetical protein